MGIPLVKGSRAFLYFIINVLLIIILSFTLVDTMVAARAEHRVSQHIYHQSHLATPPHVQMVGFPYLGAALSHELRSITVEANDIDVDSFGLISVHSSAQYVTISTKDLIQGSINNAPARKVFTRIQLDPVAIGHRLQIDNLQISNYDDISPRGGWETEAIFEGTPVGYTQPVSIKMELRIRAGDVYLTPVSVIRGPDSPSPDAPILPGEKLSEDKKNTFLHAFSLKFLGEDLPIRWRPSRIYTSGGSIYIEAEQFYTRISLTDLAPKNRILSEEEKPGL